VTSASAVARIPRAVARDRVRNSLLEAARALFDEVGYDAATTAEIAARAGVSQRTLFRYFANKEDIILDWLDDYNQWLCERLRKRPDGEPVLQALRRALDVFCHLPDADAGRLRSIRRLAVESPVVQSRLLSKYDEWEGHIADELGARGVTKNHAAMLACFAIGTLKVAFRDAPFRPGQMVEDLIDEGFEVLKGATLSYCAEQQRMTT
jgi:AcrR family transcriptional regulator